MPTTAAQHYGLRLPASIEGLSAEDFETASIRSAAPSYVSEAPSYHSTVPNSEPIPAYTPPPPGWRRNQRQQQDEQQQQQQQQTRQRRQDEEQYPTSLLAPPTSNTPPTLGLPPIPATPRHAETPQLSAFRIPSWSAVGAGGANARHYRNVAHRRASAAAASSLVSVAAAGGGAGSSWHQQQQQRAPYSVGSSMLLDAVPEGGGVGATAGAAGAAGATGAASGTPSPPRMRPLEDPYLVGEEAARKARAERLARENGDAVLELEDRRWDFFLAQMRDWEDRERSWTRFKRDYESSRTRLAGIRRLSLR